MEELGVIWRCAHDTVRGWRAPALADDICHVQRSGPTNLPLLLQIPRGFYFFMTVGKM